MGNLTFKNIGKYLLISRIFRLTGATTLAQTLVAESHIFRTINLPLFQNSIVGVARQGAIISTTNVESQNCHRE